MPFFVWNVLWSQIVSVCVCVYIWIGHTSRMCAWNQGRDFHGNASSFLSINSPILKCPPLLLWDFNSPCCVASTDGQTGWKGFLNSDPPPSRWRVSCFNRRSPRRGRRCVWTRGTCRSRWTPPVTAPSSSSRSPSTTPSTTAALWGPGLPRVRLEEVVLSIVVSREGCDCWEFRIFKSFNTALANVLEPQKMNSYDP